MIRRIRSRVGSAHLIALFALVLALTGTSIALPGKNSVDSGDIKKNAVTSADIRNKNVKAGDVKPNALGGGQINESSLGKVPSAASADNATTANSATNAANATNAGSANTTRNVLWAVVSNPGGAGDATLVRSSQPAPTVTEGTGVDVAFSRDVSGCAWVATRGATGAGVETNGFAQTGGTAGNVNSVDVRTRDSGGGITDGNFHLVVVCP